ncbi:hypothetical protein ACFSSA_09865 [Luteolibacter algae]|uniref:Uncharacterized protein n=1 Tax=Luteolibacter algae TaxID=454151 RepID=A0ABW5D971_9BACT
MNPTPPLLCGTLLAAMMAAGVSHYWSVQNFVTDYPNITGIQMASVETASAKPQSESNPKLDRKNEIQPVVKSEPEETMPVAAAESPPQEFYAALVNELKKLRDENRDLKDLMGETNRDVMKLQFQVDTYSESFRPLPTSEDRSDTTFEFSNELPGVLPPRANPVYQLDE